LYQPDSTVQLEVRLEQETVWLSQAQMAQLFQRDRTVIGRHIKNIFKEGELNPSVVCANFAHTTPHGAIQDKWQNNEIVMYNLDVIISVGYRVKSLRGTQFRIWATQTLKSYLLHGYAVTQRIERLEQKVEEHDQQIGFFERSGQEAVRLFEDECHCGGNSCMMPAYLRRADLACDCRFVALMTEWQKFYQQNANSRKQPF